MTTYAPELVDFLTPNGRVASMAVREDTVDFDICMSSLKEDEYRLRGKSLSGWAIDVGAHIGAVTIGLALDNPDLRVLAVEIVPENIDVLRMNLAQNGLSDRVTIVEAAAGGPDELSRTCYMRHRSHPAVEPDYVSKHRFIGNSFWSKARVDNGTFDSEAVEIGTVSLPGLMEQHGISEIEFIKIDCEGCEWAFLSADLSKVKYVIGEYHWDYAPQGDHATLRDGAKPAKRKDSAQAELHRIFDATHDLTVAEHPTIGLFEATRK